MNIARTPSGAARRRRSFAMIDRRGVVLSLSALTVAMLAAPGEALRAQPAASPSSVSRDPLADAFARPPKIARPDVRWWWPGAAVETAEIEREIALLDDAGFGGAEIQSFNPGIPDIAPADRAGVDGFATPAFFDHIRTASLAADKRGLKLDYTFGSSWPSGGGFAITPEKALLELTMSVTPVKGGSAAPLKVDIPARTKRLGAFGINDWVRSDEGKAWRQRFDARSRILSVRAYRGQAPSLAVKPAGGLQLTPWSDVTATGRIDPASGIDLTARLAADGTLDWSPPLGDWLVFVFRQHSSNSGVLGASGTGPQLVLDHFSRAAFDAHAGRVGTPLLDGSGQKPPGMRATFVDSLELFQDLPWSETFLAEFQARRGYDLTPYLPFLVQPGWMTAWSTHYSPPYFDAAGDADLGDRVRADYRQTVSEILVANFIKPWIAWNHAHGLKAKFQAHGAPIDTLLGYGLADIPETEDLHDAGDPHFLRLARSAAHIYGRPIVSAEAMVWGERPCSVTPVELRVRADRLFASGVTAQTVHGFTYRFNSDRWPGWFAFQPTPFGMGFSTMLQETNPVWAGVPALTAYMARLNAVLRQGEAVVPLALLHDRIGFYEGMDGRGEAGRERTAGLLASGYDYDRINLDGLVASRAEKKQLVTPGGHRFAALVLPDIASLRAEAAEQIADLAEKGVPVFFTGEIPRRETGLLDHAARDLRVQRAMERTVKAGAQLLPDENLGTALRSSGIPSNLRFKKEGTDLFFVERRLGSRRVYFIHNGGTQPRDASFVSPVSGRVERWDAMTGRIDLVTTARNGSGLDVPLELAPGTSALLVIDAAGKPGAGDAMSAVSTLDLPRDGWLLEARGHGTGGAEIKRDIPAASLGDWKVIGLDRFAGTGRYTRDFTLPRGWLRPGYRVELTLAGVHDMALVTVNGRALPAMISAPWTIDVTSALRNGSNRMEIAISNVPQNAMIDPKKPAFSKLVPVAAGLDGPVTLKLMTKGRPRR